MSCGRTVGEARTEEGGGGLGRLAGTRGGLFFLQAGHQRTVVQYVARSGALLFADVAAERVDVVHDVVGIVVFAGLAFCARREVVETGEEEFFLVGEAFQEVFDGLHVGLVVARLGVAAIVGSFAVFLGKCVEKPDVMAQFVGQGRPCAVGIDVAPFLALVDENVVDADAPGVGEAPHSVEEGAGGVVESFQLMLFRHDGHHGDASYDCVFAFLELE